MAHHEDPLIGGHRAFQLKAQPLGVVDDAVAVVAGMLQKPPVLVLPVGQDQFLVEPPAQLANAGGQARLALHEAGHGGLSPRGQARRDVVNGRRWVHGAMHPERLPSGRGTRREELGVILVLGMILVLVPAHKPSVG